jgi:hypothetical protein
MKQKPKTREQAKKIEKQKSSLSNFRHASQNNTMDHASLRDFISE